MGMHRGADLNLTAIDVNPSALLSSDRLSVLVNELNQCREDDRNANALVLQVVAAGIAALAIAFALASSGNLPYAASHSCLLPILGVGVIVALLSYISNVGIKSSIRYHYMRYLEDEIDKLCFADSEFYGWNEVSSPITTLNIHHVRSPWTAKYFISMAGCVVSALGVCIVLCASLFISHNLAYVALALVLAAPLVALFLMNCRDTSNSQKIYSTAIAIAKKKRDAKNRTAPEPENDPFQSVGEGRLIAYLIYPRLKDAMKILFILFGVMLGACFAGMNITSADSLVSMAVCFALVFLVFDYLGYQARYQWNDIRGYVEDEKNPENEKRGRLPHITNNERLSPQVSAVVAIYRIVLALIICWCNPLGLGFQLLVPFVAIFAIGVGYEFVRSLPSVPTIALLLVVSLGYPLRIFAGMLVMCPGLLSVEFFFEHTVALISLVFGSISFGMVFVGLTWALEGYDYQTSARDGDEQYHKAHVAELAKLLKNDDGLKYPLRLRHPLISVWNTAMLLSVLFMCVGIVGLSPVGGLEWGVVALLLAIFLVMAGWPGFKNGVVYLGICFVLVVLDLIVLVFVFPSAGIAADKVGLWCLMIAGTLVYLMIFTAFRNTNYDGMNDSLVQMRVKMVDAVHSIKVHLVGRDTAVLLGWLNSDEEERVTGDAASS